MTQGGFRQLVHSEKSGEGNVSEKMLTKNAVMDDRSTEKSVFSAKQKPEPAPHLLPWFAGKGLNPTWHPGPS